MGTRLLQSALIAALCGIAAPSVAAKKGPYATGLWWDPNESGWALQVAEQEGTLFLALLVHGRDGEPVWFVAPSVTLRTNDEDGDTYSGALHRTTGRWFGLGPPAGPVASGAVGTVDITFAVGGGDGGSVNAAWLAYSVDGASASRMLVPYTFRRASVPAGTYTGVVTGIPGSCLEFARSSTAVQLDVGEAQADGSHLVAIESSAARCEGVGVAETFGTQLDLRVAYQCVPAGGGATKHGHLKMIGIRPSSTGFTAGGWARSNVDGCSTAFRIAVLKR